MKIHSITTSNFIGARSVDLKLSKTVALIAGKNGSGKSSLQEAVRMALTGEPVRVQHKKDYGALITEGQESGFASVSTADLGDFAIVLPSGKGNHCDISALPYILDAQRFASLDDNARRSFLFGLMGVKLDGPTVKQRLLDKGCDAGKVEQIAPILRAGFDAAAKEAANKARDAKAGYKTATGGDTWGKEKGGKWQPAALPDGADRAAAKVESIAASLTETNAALAAANQELGAAKAEQRRQQSIETRRMELHEQAGMTDRIKAKLEKDTAELAEWEKKVADCRARAGGKLNPKAPGEFLLRGLASVTADFLALTCEYSEVNWPDELINRAAAHIGEYKKLHGEPVKEQAKADPEAAAKLPEYENALALLQSSVANGNRDLEAANAAAIELAAIDNGAATANVDALEKKVSDLTETRNNWQADLAKYREIADQYARRKVLIDQVAKLHADVLAWTDIADALSPDGIPSELLSEALGPINTRLFASAGFAEWEVVTIGADMSISYGDRDYALISESQQWRVDAMIAEAVSHISGAKLLVLDRFDVLDMKGREDLMYWLDGMADDGEIDTALIFGTLKALPAQFLPNIEGFWIENGTIASLKVAA